MRFSLTPRRIVMTAAALSALSLIPRPSFAQG
jgi:hypothetical protein